MRNLLADRYVECEVARLMAYNVAWMQGEGLVPNKEASMSKAFGSETLHRSANSVLEVAGLQGALGRGEKRAPLKGRLPENWMISFPTRLRAAPRRSSEASSPAVAWGCPGVRGDYSSSPDSILTSSGVSSTPCCSRAALMRSRSV